MTDCIFCKMVSGDIKPNIVYEDELVLAFRDINPQAPIHLLVIPKQHIPTLGELDDEVLAGRMLRTAALVAEQEGFAGDGYRVVFNCNKNGGQEVYHVHLHVMGGRQMTWPPG